MNAQRVSVVVVGAGFAGLAAATRLRESGLDVVVLEAADRVGGRTDTAWHGERWFELGGQWAGPGQTEVAALARSLGIETFETPTAGLDVVIRQRRPVDAESDEVLAGMAEVVARLDELALAVPAHEAWLAPHAEELDRTLLTEWLADEVDDVRVRHAVARVLAELACVPAHEQSLLFVTHMARSSGTLAASLGIEGGAQEHRFVGGLHGLAVGLASGLGDAVRLSTPVRGISWSSHGGASVETDGGVVDADRVVVAVPPNMSESIVLDPVAPQRAGLSAAVPMGAVIKLHLVFPEPFWRGAGRSGLVLDDAGPFAFVADNTPPDDEAGHLVTFISAENVAHWGDGALGASGRQRRRDAFLEHIRTALGPSVPEPVDYEDRDWTAVPFVGGGYSGVPRPGTMLDAGPRLGRPVGPVHFAGAELGSMWNGYVEGALRSGHATAAEVLASLSG